MSRVARWRRGSNDPTTVRGWLWRSGISAPYAAAEVPEPAQGRRKWIALAFLTYLIVAMTVILVHPKGTDKFVAFLNVPLAFVPAVAMARRKPTAVVGEGPGESVRARASIMDAHGNPTGKDTGWLVSSEGWLLFEGERTSFALTRGEARSSRFESTLLFLDDGRRVGFSVPGDKPDPLPLSLLIAHWDASDIPDGEAILPPSEPHPARWVDSHTAWIAGAVALVILAWFGLAFGFAPVVALAVLGIVGCVAMAQYCAGQLREELPTLEARATSSLSPMERP